MNRKRITASEAHAIAMDAYRETNEMLEDERRADQEAMAQWLRDGTVTDDYLRSVLGDPRESVAVPYRP